MVHHITPARNQSGRPAQGLQVGQINFVYRSNVRGKIVCQTNPLIIENFSIFFMTLKLFFSFCIDKTFRIYTKNHNRVASMPNTGVEEEYYRLRHFSITGKGIVNRGDSLKSRRSRSNTSVASSNSRWVFNDHEKFYFSRFFYGFSLECFAAFFWTIWMLLAFFYTFSLKILHKTQEYLIIQSLEAENSISRCMTIFNFLHYI